MGTTPGKFCFKKNEHWASCNETCNEKMKWNNDKQIFEEQAEKVWDCHKLSCTANGENCMASKCCSEPGMTCFKKNDHWASCNETCNEKMKWSNEKQQFEEQAEKVWDCDVVSAEPTCTKNGANCMDTKCCTTPGNFCFKKNEHWASCNETCNEKMKWNNDKQIFEEQAEKVWDCHKLSCTANGENCMASKCCSEPGMTCFKKNDHWVSCNATCNEKMKWNNEKQQFE